MIYGYARVSKKDQNLHLQIKSLNEYGVDKIYTDKISSVKPKREELDVVLSVMTAGDTFVIWKLDRLGRTLRQLLDLADEFDRRNISFVSLSETIDTKTPMGRAFFVICAAFAQLERETISMRTIAGLDAAREQGRIGGRPKKERDKIDRALKMYKLGLSVEEIRLSTSVSPHTLYKYLHEEIVAMYKSGMSIDEISHITRYRKQSIERLFDQMQNGEDL